jgi:DNA-binding FadR family transcriptional regulator
VFTRVRRPRAAREIVDQIEQAIFNEQLRPGDRLDTERDLADRFGVSRITVRDALHELETRGLLHVKVGSAGGAFISDTNVEQLSESLSTLILLRRMTLPRLAEARTAVEAATAELAARHARPMAIAELRRIALRGRAAVAQQTAHTAASVEFHIAVAEASGNEFLAATVASYRRLLTETLRAMREVRSARTIQRVHEQIVDAITAHDDQRARALMLSHLQDFERRLQMWLATQDGSDLAFRVEHANDRADG